MEIFQIVALGIISAILVTILKKYKPEIALQVGIITGVVIFVMMLSKITLVLGLLNDITSKVNIELVYFAVILKIIGIAYITEFGSEVCRDAGEGTIAMKLEFAGKIMIIALAAPIIYALIDLVVKILP